MELRKLGILPWPGPLPCRRCSSAAGLLAPGSIFSAWRVAGRLLHRGPQGLRRQLPGHQVLQQPWAGVIVRPPGVELLPSGGDGLARDGVISKSHALGQKKASISPYGSGTLSSIHRLFQRRPCCSSRRRRACILSARLLLGLLGRALLSRPPSAWDATGNVPRHRRRPALELHHFPDPGRGPAPGVCAGSWASPVPGSVPCALVLPCARRFGWPPTRVRFPPAGCSSPNAAYRSLSSKSKHKGLHIPGLWPAAIFPLLACCNGGPLPAPAYSISLFFADPEVVARLHCALLGHGVWMGPVPPGPRSS